MRSSSRLKRFRHAAARTSRQLLNQRCESTPPPSRTAEPGGSHSISAAGAPHHRQGQRSLAAATQSALREHFDRHQGQRTLAAATQSALREHFDRHQGQRTLAAATQSALQEHPTTAKDSAPSRQPPNQRCESTPPPLRTAEPGGSHSISAAGALRPPRTAHPRGRYPISAARAPHHRQGQRTLAAATQSALREHPTTVKDSAPSRQLLNQRCGSTSTATKDSAPSRQPPNQRCESTPPPSRTAEPGGSHSISAAHDPTADNAMAPLEGVGARLALGCNFAIVAHGGFA